MTNIERDIGDPIEPVNPELVPQGVQFCKAIIPRDEAAAGNGRYSTSWPRIVQSDFNTPANWVEVARYEDGETITEISFDNNGNRIRRPVTNYFGQVLVHTCKKPYDDCADNGFWGRWRK